MTNFTLLQKNVSFTSFHTIIIHFVTSFVFFLANAKISDVQPHLSFFVCLWRHLCVWECENRHSNVQERENNCFSKRFESCISHLRIGFERTFGRSRSCNLPELSSRTIYSLIFLLSIRFFPFFVKTLEKIILFAFRHRKNISILAWQ